MLYQLYDTYAKVVALRKESVDRNVFLTLTVRNVLMSLSARRAWIEICPLLMFWLFRPVALRKESVDRNIDNWTWTAGMWVALRKESVDRNMISPILRSATSLSLSARRAWIEILMWWQSNTTIKESLSARRAWIEM